MGKKGFRRCLLLCCGLDLVEEGWRGWRCWQRSRGRGQCGFVPWRRCVVSLGGPHGMASWRWCGEQGRRTSSKGRWLVERLDLTCANHDHVTFCSARRKETRRTLRVRQDTRRGVACCSRWACVAYRLDGPSHFTTHTDPQTTTDDYLVLFFVSTDTYIDHWLVLLCVSSNDDESDPSASVSFPSRPPS